MFRTAQATGPLRAGFLPLGILLLSVGVLRAADTADRNPERLLARRILDATGVKGGLVVHGRLYRATVDGRIVCRQGE